MICIFSVYIYLKFRKLREIRHWLENLEDYRVIDKHNLANTQLLIAFGKTTY